MYIKERSTKLLPPLFLQTTLFIFLIIPFFAPKSFEYIYNFQALDHMLNILRAVLSVVILFWYILKFRISKIMLCVISLHTVWFVSTFLNGGSFSKLFISAGTTISFCMLVELGIQHSPSAFFSALSKYLGLLVLINFVLMLMFPGGLLFGGVYGHRYHFLSIENALDTFIIPYMAFLAIDRYIKGYQKMGIFNIMMLFICSLTMLIAWSATGLVAWFIMIVFLLFFFKKKMEKFINFGMLMGIYVFCLLALVIFRIQFLFAPIIEGILGKSLTFTGRTELWDLSFRLIQQAPVLGHGHYSGPGVLFWRNFYFTPHNGILDILIMGGTIAILFFAALFFLSGNSLMKHRNHSISALLSLTIFSWMVILLMESFANHYILYAFLVMGFHVNKIIDACAHFYSKPVCAAQF